MHNVEATAAARPAVVAARLTVGRGCWPNGREMQRGKGQACVRGGGERERKKEKRKKGGLVFFFFFFTFCVVLYSFSSFLLKPSINKRGVN